MGQTSLNNAQTYNNTTAYNVGAQLNASYPTLFDVNGKFVGSESTNLGITFELEFLCKNSSMIIFKSYLSIINTAGAFVDGGLQQGVHFNSGTTFNNTIHYNIGPFKHIILTGHQIMLNTTYQFTANTTAGVGMTSKFTIERNPL